MMLFVSVSSRVLLIYYTLVWDACLLNNIIILWTKNFCLPVNTDSRFECTSLYLKKKRVKKSILLFFFIFTDKLRTSILFIISLLFSSSLSGHFTPNLLHSNSTGDQTHQRDFLIYFFLFEALFCLHLI